MKTKATPTAIKIVLLPGLDGTGILYQQLAEQLAPAYLLQVIAYPPQELWGYAQLLDYITPQLPESPYVLIAESFSGPLGVLVAAQQSPHLKGLVLCCTFGRNPLPAIKGLKSTIDRLPWNELVHQWTVAWLQGRFASAELSALLRKALTMVSEKVIKYRAKQVLQIDVVTVFSGLTLPLLYLQASQDRLIWDFNAQTLLQANPAMQLVRLDAPHFLLQAIPEQAAAHLVAFIENKALAAFQVATEKAVS